MDEMRPVRAIPIPPEIHVTFMSLSKKSNGDVLTIGYDNGEIHVLIDFNFEKRMILKQHDGHTGAISGVCFNSDESLIISTGHDGLVIVN